MGACCSDSIEKKIPASWFTLFRAMNFTRREISAMYDIFNLVDFSGDGAVDVVELLTMLDIERTPFTEQIMSLFDADNSGQVDFREFVLALWNYCTCNDSALQLFTFDLYDRSHSGRLSPEEVVGMMKDIYGNNYASNRTAHDVEHHLLQLDKKLFINPDLFSNFTKNHQAIMFPAFNVRAQMQNKVLGFGFWKKASARRIMISDGKYIPVGDLVKLRLSPALMEATISDSNLLRINSKAKLVLRAQMRPAPYVPPIEEEAPSSYHSHGTARDGTACRPSNPEVSPHRRGSTRNTSTTTTTTSGANAGTSTGMGEDSARRTGFSAGSPPTSRPSSRPPTPTSGRKSPKHSPRAHEHAHDGNTPPISPDLRTSARGTTVHSKMKKSDVKGKEGITAKPSPSVKPSTFSTPVAVAGF